MPDLSLLSALPGRVAAEGRTARRVDVMASEVLSLDAGNAPIGRLFVTDALHPFEGDLSPLPRLFEQAQHEQSTVISIEAHGLGVLGATGGGVAEHLGIAGQGDLHLLSLGALGGHGWVAAGKRPLVAAVQAFTAAAPSLGSMVYEARVLVTTAWWTMVGPGVLLVLLVVGLNLIGDALRDVLDPRRTGRSM